MKYFILIFVFLGLQGCWTGVPRPSEEGIEAHFQRFNTLRQQDSHFEGGKWNVQVDPFESPMHQSLLAIEAYFRSNPPTETELIKALGEPDARSTPQCDSCWAYFWRGWHDYLYFKFNPEGRQAEVKWYQALK